jgi:aryl-alcohol dehydrogenase-like predicted oxidoreductase
MDEFRKYTASNMKAQARMKVALDQGVRFFDTAMQ